MISKLACATGVANIGLQDATDTANHNLYRHISNGVCDQNAQNRESTALQFNLDELIRVPDARDKFVGSNTVRTGTWPPSKPRRRFAAELTLFAEIILPELRRDYPAGAFGRKAMKSLVICTALLGLAAYTSAAQAKGCIKGAIVGGVAGSAVGHGKVGAAAGCVIGHHEANKADATKTAPQTTGQTK